MYESEEAEDPPINLEFVLAVQIKLSFLIADNSLPPTSKMLNRIQLCQVLCNKVHNCEFSATMALFCSVHSLLKNLVPLHWLYFQQQASSSSASSVRYPRDSLHIPASYSAH